MLVDIEMQYDKIYRYCYFKLNNREVAEDITQETFLRYLKNYNCLTTTSALKCLYTIARNLCIDEYRKPKFETIDESILDSASEDNLLMNITVKMVLFKLTDEEKELLLLRYVNEVPISVLAEIYGISRFAIYRKLTVATNKFRDELQKED